MAWIFSLSAECGTEKSVAERLVQHFQNYDPEFEDGSRHPVTAYLEEIDGACWVICVPAGITPTGMDSANDERVITQVAITL